MYTHIYFFQITYTYILICTLHWYKYARKLNHMGESLRTNILSCVIIFCILRYNCFVKNNNKMYIVVSWIIYLIDTKSILHINLQDNDKWFCRWEQIINSWLDNQCTISEIKSLKEHLETLLTCKPFIGLFLYSIQITVD